MYILSNEFCRKIKLAFVANAKPAIYLQLFALLVGLSYFYIPVLAPAFVFLANLKSQYGVWYAIMSTSIFGGLLPYLVMFFTNQITFKPVTQLLFYCLLWAFMGALVDTFYQFQSFLFGDNNDVFTIVKKVLFDQFVFTVFVTSPLITCLFLIRDCRFNLRLWLDSTSLKLLTEQLPATLLSTWIVWIPAVCIIYAMPSTLQIPLFNIVLCMFVLILAIVNKPEEH